MEQKLEMDGNLPWNLYAKLFDGIFFHSNFKAGLGVVFRYTESKLILAMASMVPALNSLATECSAACPAIIIDHSMGLKKAILEGDSLDALPSPGIGKSAST